MKANTLILLFLGMFFFTGCKKDEPIEEPTDEYGLTVNFDFSFNGNSFEIAPTEYTNEANNPMRFSRFRFLISEITLIEENGNKRLLADEYAYISIEGDRTSFTISSKIAEGNYSGIEFIIGLPDDVNHSDPNSYPVDHPLSPVLNGMHWDWTGGYKFLSMEGFYNDSDGEEAGFSYHIGSDVEGNENLIPIEITGQSFSFDSDKTLTLEFKVDEVFKNPNVFDINIEGNVSHSNFDGGSAQKLIENTVNTAIVVKSFN